MGQIRISDAAILLGVSDDTVRRWIDNGTLEADRDSAGPLTVDGAALAAIAVARAHSAPAQSPMLSSARNRFVGIVTRVVIDTVMAQVDLQCGPHRVVSLMSAEAVRETGLEVGSIATALVKATQVIVETPAADPAPTPRNAD